MVKKLILGALLLSAPTIATGPAQAAGLHLGWCIGVGNNHQTTDCDTGGGTSMTTGVPDLVTPPLGATTMLAPTLPLGPGKLSKPKPGGGYALVPFPQPVPIPPLAPGQVPIAVPYPHPVAVPPMVPQMAPGRVPTAVPYPQPVAVPPLVPLLVPGRVPTAVPYPQPVAVPPMVPQLVPGRVPTAVPYPQPVAVPSMVPPMVQSPGLVPIQVPVARPIPKPVQAPGKSPAQLVTTTSTGGPSAGTTGGIASKPVPGIPGRQPAHLRPVYADASGTGAIECVSAGYGPRRLEAASGAIRHAGQIDSFARDVPARHPDTARCLIQLRHKR